MRKHNGALWFFVVVGIVVVGSAGYLLLRPSHEPASPIADASSQSKDQGDSLQAEAEYVMIGGVRRRRSDLPQAMEDRRLAREKEMESLRNSQKITDDVGKRPAVPINANPQVKSVVEAIREKSHPERVSALVAPKPFDAKAYAANPASYLNVCEPGRAFQSAQPGPGVSRIERLTPYAQTVQQGKSVTLQVRVPAKSPVTFTSFDLGQFSNQLTSITVEADENGIAETEFVATPGTINRLNILAASPVTSGQAEMVVDVRLPQKASSNTNAQQAAK